MFHVGISLAPNTKNQNFKIQYGRRFHKKILMFLTSPRHIGDLIFLNKKPRIHTFQNFMH